MDSLFCHLLLSPIVYWLFNYIVDMFIATLWFSYVLAIYCVVYVAFEGLPKKLTGTGPGLEFAPAWDLRVQFYPLCILIALPTMPFIYLFIKIFKSDILVRSFFNLFLRYFEMLTPPMVSGWIDGRRRLDFSSHCQYYCRDHREYL